MHLDGRVKGSYHAIKNVIKLQYFNKLMLLFDLKE